METEPFMTFANGFKILFAGILSVLWWDVRKVGKVKENMDKEIADTYLTQDKHTDLCTIASLEMKRHVSQEIQASEGRIIEAINNNGKEHT